MHCCKDIHQLFKEEMSKPELVEDQQVECYSSARLEARLGLLLPDCAS